MKRRSFLEILTAFTAAFFLPPLRAAKAVQQQVRERVKPVTRWLSGRKHWEHLPVPVPLPESHVRYGGRDAQIVCRVLGPTHFNTNLHPKNGEFEAALEEAGWFPRQIKARVDPSYGEWGVSLPCLACDRRVWVPAEATEGTHSTYFGWQIEQKSGEWLVRCPDHVAQS